MNENLAVGTQLPYIRRAQEEGYGVIVLNTNENIDVDGSGEKVEDKLPIIRTSWQHNVRSVSTL